MLTSLGSEAAVYQYFPNCPVTLPDPNGPPGGCPANWYPMSNEPSKCAVIGGSAMDGTAR
jgi:hypothetical protein